MSGEQRRVLVTGGAGFIGSHAASRLRRDGFEVVVFDDLSRPGAGRTARRLVEQGTARLVIGDVVDVRAVARLFAEHGPFDAVLHQAAQVAVTRSVAEPLRDFEVNALGTLHLLEASRRQAERGAAPAFLYSSTNKVYGALRGARVGAEPTRMTLPDLPDGVPEDAPLELGVPYGCSKGAADQYVVTYAKVYGLPTTVFRQSCIYGTEQHGLEDQGWVAWLAIAAELGLPVHVFGDGRQTRDVLWVDDLVDLYSAALAAPGRVAGEVFNVGGGPASTLSLREFLARLSAHHGRAVPVRHLPVRPGDQPVYVSCLARARERLGWEPKVGLDEGLSRLFAWVGASREEIERTLAEAATRPSREASTPAPTPSPGSS